MVSLFYLFASDAVFRIKGKALESNTIFIINIIGESINGEAIKNPTNMKRMMKLIPFRVKNLYKINKAINGFQLKIVQK